MRREFEVFFPFEKMHWKTHCNLSHVSAMSWKTKKCCFMENYLLQKRFYGYIIICGRHRCFLRALWFKTAIMDGILISWRVSRVWALLPGFGAFFLILLPGPFQWLVQSSHCRVERRSRERCTRGRDSLFVRLLVPFLSQIQTTSTVPRHPEHKVGPKQNISCIQEATKIASASAVKGI